jgi:hypothetical protein
VERLAIFALLLLMACKRHDPNPEMKDPIYGDLIKQAENANRQWESAKRDLEEAQKALTTADVQNGEIKARRNSVFEYERILDKATQHTKFCELEVERRKDYDRKSYEEAFQKDKEWPNPEEFQEYQANQRLVNIPENYDETHKKRLQERAPASQKAPAKKEE